MEASPYASERDLGWGAYNEKLQEDLYLGGPSPLAGIQVKNTFIHFDTRSSPSPMNGDGPRVMWRTAPGIVLERSFHTKYPLMEQAHIRGDCRPCAYHVYKTDGCRHGDACQFCHLCTRGEIKRRKKEKAKVMKGQEGLLETESLTAAAASPPGTPAGSPMSAGTRRPLALPPGVGRETSSSSQPRVARVSTGTAGTPSGLHRVPSEEPVRRRARASTGI